MKKLITNFICLMLLITLSACLPNNNAEPPAAPVADNSGLTAQTPVNEPDNAVNENLTADTSKAAATDDISWSTLEELVSLMTLEEKVGQMTQAERQDLNRFDVTNYFIGSVLSGGGSAPQKNEEAEWVLMVYGFVKESLQTRLGIPVIYGIDAVHGHNNLYGATILPHNVGLGAIAAGDIEKGIDAAFKAGQITADEMLATGIRWDFAPVLGVPEDVRWGRTYEGYGENVDLVTALGSAFIKGLQGDLQTARVAACMKHYIGEGQTTDGHNQGNANLTDEDIRRILPPYINAINSGALTLMPSFSSVNGIKMHEHKELLTGILKEELGFEGFIISDWAAITQLSGGSYKMQIANAINAGVDMVMATNGRDSWVSYIKNLKELVNEGTVSMERIDDAVLRILRVKQKLGLFETPLKENPGKAGTQENRNIARTIAADSLVLLKNENNIISKLKDYNNILVAGQGANDIGMQCGGWTIHWQGGHGEITEGTTILEGIEKVSNAAVTYSEDGVSDKKFDVIIAVVGEEPYAETDGDRYNDINLRLKDAEMLENVYKLGCPVIVVMLSGRPMTIGDEIDKWDAFIAAWLPGTEGSAIADAMFLDRDFVGKTPYTWRKSIGGEVLFPYGFGLNKY